MVVDKGRLMKKLSRDLSYEMARRLIKGGCPLDPEVEQQMRDAYRGLEVHQGGSIVENSIFDLECGGMGLMITAEIGNATAHNLRLQQFRMKLPWDDPSFCWIEDPNRKLPRKHLYEFPKPSQLAFEREVVLNHRTGSNGLWLPGEWIEGLLLGIGQMCIPEQYGHARSLTLQLQVLDSCGRDYAGEFRVLADREFKRARRKKCERI